jgi:hypothetical protein
MKIGRDAMTLKMKMIWKGGHDDWIAYIILGGIEVALGLTGIAVKNAKPCKPIVTFEDRGTTIAIIIKKYCLAITQYGHIHVRGEKVWQTGKPFMAKFELRLEKGEMR